MTSLLFGHRPTTFALCVLLAGSCEVCAKDLVEQARSAIKKDPCHVLRRIASIRLKDADTPLFHALSEADFAVKAPIKMRPLTDCYTYPCLPARDLLEAIAELGFMHKIIGVSLDTARAQLTHFWNNFQLAKPGHEVCALGCKDRLIPYYLHGDGGRTYKKDSVLVLSMFPCLGKGTSKRPVNLSSTPSRPSSSPCGRLGAKRALEVEGEFDMGINLKGNSLANRFLFTAINTDQYKDDKRIFDGLLNVWGEEMADLFEKGFHHSGTGTWKIVVVGLTGDAPFLRDAGNHNRSFLNAKKSNQSGKKLPGVCWLCEAGKTDGPLFEEVGLTNASWIATSGSANTLPWDCPGALLKHMLLDEDDIASFYRPDLFHILHAGTFKEFSASCMIYIMKTLLKQRSMAASLSMLNDNLREFLSSHKGERIHFKKLTLDLLGYQSSRDYPSGCWSKSLDSAVMMKFVAYIIGKPDHEQQVQEDQMLQLMRGAAENGNKFMSQLFSCGYWLNFEEADTVIRCGHRFLMSYHSLAKAAFGQQLCLFSLKPKLHMYNHILHTLWTQRKASPPGQPAIVNPCAEATFMSEDFIGRVARLSRKVSPRQQGLKVLFRYLVAAHMTLSSEG